VARRDWLDPVREALEAAPRPVVFSVRDDDVGWADARLLGLLDLFAGYEIPLDLAVIPIALGPALARVLCDRKGAEPALLHFHQHGYAHENHEPEGRPCEFGPSRPADAQRRDIEAGAHRLEELLGPTAPLFTPPWNRCTETTARCLRELGFAALVRDSTSAPLELGGLRDVAVNVDWSARRENGLADRLAARVLAGGPVRLMLHHALMGRQERGHLEPLLALVASHRNVRCEPLAASVATG
jgi:hypothetical protein